MNQQTLLIALTAAAVVGLVGLAVTSPPEERRNHFAQLCVAVAVGAFFLLIYPPS